jgi:hypothetical protein
MSDPNINTYSATEAAKRALDVLRRAADEAYDNRQDALCGALNLAWFRLQDAIIEHGVHKPDEAPTTKERYLFSHRASGP